MPNTAKKIKLRRLIIITVLIMAGLTIITLGIPRYQDYQKQNETVEFFSPGEGNPQ